MNTLTDTERLGESVGIAQHPDPSTFHSPDEFTNRIYREWTEGSCIAHDLYRCGVSLVPDLELGAGGEILAAPIHAALGWQFKRFRHQSTPTQYAALLYTLNPERNWQREVFQAKLSHPIWDAKKGKYRKYESPKGLGVRGGFPPVSDRVWWLVADDAGIYPCCPAYIGENRSDRPTDFEFWTWVSLTPSIPITITEGYKKAQHLLSKGHACIALSGITMGVFNPDGTGKRLRPYLQLFAQESRQVFIALDTETKPKTRRDVSRETRKLGICYSDAGCTVNILRIPLLPDTSKTGIDDYGVAKGSEAIARLYRDAQPYPAWLWHRRYWAKRSRRPSLKLSQSELKLNEVAFPEKGIIAIESCKGSGKTNSIRSLLAYSPKALLLTHRVCLGRSLAQRLNIAWKTDTDRGHGTWIVDGDTPTQRLGLCVDSLLSIDPAEFRDCDLVLDEVDQVVHHLLSSSTCNKGGRRPALLARFHDLIRVAKRVIIASADLTDDELTYVENLRKNSDSAFLVRNTHVPKGYPIELLEAPKSALISRLLEAIALQQKVFVATDSKSDSNTIAQLLTQIENAAPASKTLIINSDTSGGDIEVEFIRNVNEDVLDYDIVIATPSMATGVSIEVEHFDCVFGLFNGVLSDSDIAQALARVRAPIPRIVWCASTGKNFNKASKSDYPLRVQQDLLTRWDTEIALIRTSLRPDLGSVVEEEYGFRNNPHLDHWARIIANTNSAMWWLRGGLAERLRLEGNHVSITVIENEDADELKKQIKEARDRSKQAEFERVVDSRVLSELEFSSLQQQEKRTPQQLRDERKTTLSRFYILDEADITSSWVELDDWGRFRGKVVELEALLQGQAFAITRDSRGIARQAYWLKGLFLPDQSCFELKRQVRELLGLHHYIDPSQEWSSQDLEPLCALARQQAKAIKNALGYSVTDSTSNGQIFRALLSQLGIKCRTRFVGPRGEQTKLYRIDEEHWELLTQILERREMARTQDETESATVSTPPINQSIQVEVDTAPLKEGQWVKWTKHPSLSWMVDAIDRGTCRLKGVTGKLRAAVPLPEVQRVRLEGAN
ncbi:MAG: plasmid replication protein, CyRepA1 family [Synechococcus sp.]